MCYCGRELVIYTVETTDIDTFQQYINETHTYLIKYSSPIEKFKPDLMPRLQAVICVSNFTIAAISLPWRVSQAGRIFIELIGEYCAAIMQL